MADDAVRVAATDWIGTAEKSDFADVVNLHSGPYGVTISFGQSPIGVFPAQEVARVHVSWQQVVVLKRLIERVERRYKAAGGTPDLPPSLLSILGLSDDDLQKADSEPLFTFPQSPEANRG